MITIETFQDGTKLWLFTADRRRVDYGHFQIEVELRYRGQGKTFRTTTTDMEAIDAAIGAEEESWEDSKLIMFETVKPQIEEKIQNWMNDVDYDLDHE